MGFVIIDSDEYKDLILAKESAIDSQHDCKLAVKLMKEARENLEELLLFITKGNKKAEFEDKFHSYDIASVYDLAEFINNNYVDYGILSFKKVKKENEDEQGN